MKLIVFVAILIVIGFAVYFAAKLIQHQLNRKAEWTIQRQYDGPYEEVFLTHPVAKPRFIGRVHLSDDDYGDKIIELVSMAEDELFEKNSVQKALRR